MGLTTQDTNVQQFRKLICSADVAPAVSTLPIVVRTINPILDHKSGGSQIRKQSQELAQAISVALNPSTQSRLMRPPGNPVKIYSCHLSWWPVQKKYKLKAGPSLAMSSCHTIRS